MHRALALSLCVSLAACSSAGTTPVPGGGGDRDAATPNPAPGPTATPDGGPSSPPPAYDAGPGVNPWDGGAIPPECQTYADKGMACCAAMSGCNVTRDAFINWCAGFYASCSKYYACYVSASSCAAAENCPGASAGGCS